MITIRENCDSSEYSYIRVGGIVREWITCDSLYDLKRCKRERFLAVGNTSKILFAFRYFPGTVLRYTCRNIAFSSDRFFAHAGCSLSECYFRLRERSIGGFELLSTIPGAVGGSIVNNASFLGQCISDHLEAVLIYQGGAFQKIAKEDCGFSYRKSNLQRENLLVVGAWFTIRRKDEREQEETRKRGIAYRKAHQGEHARTLGSTFKNPPGASVGRILDELGYRGYRFSENVRLSPRHGNFILVEPKTNYLEVSSFLTFLKAILYNYLRRETELEIIVIGAYGREYHPEGTSEF